MLDLNTEAIHSQHQLEQHKGGISAASRQGLSCRSVRCSYIQKTLSPIKVLLLYHTLYRSLHSSHQITMRYVLNLNLLCRFTLGVGIQTLNQI